MERRNTLTTLEEILIILKKNKEMSFNQLQRKSKTQWRTLKACLDFLIKTKLIKERKTGKEKNSTRLFSLVED
jgi:predicted transcriptional regulator